MSNITGTMSNTRCARTVPTSVAHRPLRRGTLRVSTATRASSPILPGRTAFANRPTENAEKTVVGFGCGGGIAELITVVHASARTTTEARLMAMATTTHSHTTAVNASPIARKLGPRHQKSANTAPRKTTASASRPASDLGGWIRLTPRRIRRCRRGGPRSRPRRSAAASARGRRRPSPRGEARPRAATRLRP